MNEIEAVAVLTITCDALYGALNFYVAAGHLVFMNHSDQLHDERM